MDVNHALLVGTSKGLVVFDLNTESITPTHVHFKGLPISMLYIDHRSDTWWVSIAHRHWGEKLHYSNDKGKSWESVTAPSYAGYDYKPGVSASLKKVWVMNHAGGSTKDGLWVGTEPGGLFYSEDNGKSFILNEGLWNLPSRQDNNQWFGTGKDYPFIHSILIDPRNKNHVYVGVSCAGVFESLDGGKSWHPKNNGLIATYLPKANVEIGHDPHQMVQCQINPDVIWQQNHCGIFRTTNGGNEWQLVSEKNGFPSYGFALVVDHSDCNTAWVIPAESDESRVPVNLGLKVCKTIDGGQNWEIHSNGLPQKNSFDLVLRHGFVKQGDTLAFGTNNGNLYLSTDRGNNWNLISCNLAAINSLAFAMNI